jgi:hypothetical protein
MPGPATMAKVPGIALELLARRRHRPAAARMGRRRTEDTMTANRKAKAAARALAADSGRSYTHARRAEVGSGESPEMPAVFGPVADRHWNEPGSGTEDRWPHWRSDVRRHHARMALRLPDGRAHHLAGRWTSPRRGGLHYDYGKNAAALLTVLYSVVLWETPTLAPGEGHVGWLLEQAEDERALGAFDSAFYTVDRAVRMLAGQHFGDSRHSPGTNERIAAYLEATKDDYRDAARRVRAGWRDLHRPFEDSEGYPHVVVPWTGTRQILDAVLIRATGGLLPGTPVRVTSGPSKGRESHVGTAWWGNAQPPTGYLLSGGSVPYGEPFSPTQLEPHPGQQ